MNQAIEMHDSECVAVEVDEEGRGSVLLDAYVHRTADEPGVSLGEGGVQRIRMKIDALTVEGDVGVLPASIYIGSLTVGNSVQYNIIPFPATYREAVRLSMTLLDDGRVILVSGKDISIEVEEEFKFVETVDFAGH